MTPNNRINGHGCIKCARKSPLSTRKRKVKNIIAKTVGDDVALLSQQVNETNDMLIAMYGISYKESDILRKTWI